MKFYEYNAREIFYSEGIVTSEGKVAVSPSEVFEIAKTMDVPVVLKSQVLTGGRGKAGGIKFVTSPEEAKQIASELFSKKIKGYPVTKILVAKKENIKKEYYLGITINFQNRKTSLIFSTEGGVDIEELALKSPEKIIKIEIDPVIGLQNYHLTPLTRVLGYKKDIFNQLKNICKKLYLIYEKYDCLLVEINPLALIEEEGIDKLIAVDAKLESDDNANYRQTTLTEMWDEETEEKIELIGKRAGFVTIKLNGMVSIVSNGAGNAIYALDLLKKYEISTANILDLSGGATPDKVQRAVNVVIQDEDVKVILFNVFGGITRCDEIAKGIVQSKQNIPPNIPVVCRLQGTNREEGIKILNDSGLEAFMYLEDAIKKIVKLIDNQGDVK
jgi:succinyl-CoA synthetase beta subunit